MINLSSCDSLDKVIERVQLGTLLDGEGCITCNFHQGHIERGTLQVLVSLGMTDAYYPRHFYKRYEGSYGEVEPTGKRKRITYTWRVNGADCRRVLEDAYPYLNIKRKQADLVLAFIKTIAPHVRTSEAVWELRMKIFNVMQTLNAKGVRETDGLN